MTRHIVARTTDIPPGGNKVVGVEGRDIVVFHVNGEFFALLNRCPHAGAPLDKAACVARLTSPEPGVYRALARRRTPALRLARLGIRHAQRPVLVRPEARQGPLLSGRRRKRRRTCRRAHMWPRPFRSMSRTATSSSRPEPPQHLSTHHHLIRRRVFHDARHPLSQNRRSRSSGLGGSRRSASPDRARRASATPRSD